MNPSPQPPDLSEKTRFVLRCPAMQGATIQCSRDIGHAGDHISRALVGSGCIGWPNRGLTVSGSASASATDRALNAINEFDSAWHRAQMGLIEAEARR